LITPLMRIGKKR